MDHSLRREDDVRLTVATLQELVPFPPSTFSARTAFSSRNHEPEQQRDAALQLGCSSSFVLTTSGLPTDTENVHQCHLKVSEGSHSRGSGEFKAPPFYN